MNRAIDPRALILEGVEALKKYNVMAVPGIIADLAVLLIWVAIQYPLQGSLQDPMLDIRPFVLFVLVNMIFSIFALGLTLGMAREYTESGKTSLKTAAFIGQRLFPSLLALSLLCPLVFLTGLVMYVVPGLVAGCFMMFAMPAVIAGGLGPYDALVKSIVMVRENLAASARVYATVVLSAFILGIIGVFLSLIPVIGLIVNLVIQGAFMAVMSLMLYRAYRLLDKLEPQAETRQE